MEAFTDAELADQVRQGLKDKGLPEGSPLSVLLHQHRVDAALAATFRAIAESNQEKQQKEDLS